MKLSARERRQLARIEEMLLAEVPHLRALITCLLPGPVSPIHPPLRSRALRAVRRGVNGWAAAAVAIVAVLMLTVALPFGGSHGTGFRAPLHQVSVTMLGRAGPG